MKIKHKVDEQVKITSSIRIVAVPELDKSISDLAKSQEVVIKKSLEYGEVEVIVSNSGLDRHGEKILMEGIDTKQVMRNPVVLWGHQYSELPIGQIKKLWRSEGNLMAKIKLDYDIYEFADTVYKMILRGTLNAVSIGGIVKEWNEDFTIVKQLEMLELSVVPVGAHPDALVTAKSLGMKKAELQKQYEDFVQKSLVDKVKDLPQNEIELYIKSLKALVSALEISYKDASTVTDNTKESPETNSVKKLIIVRQAAKQCDKQSELIIAAVSNKLKLVSYK